MKYLTFWNIKNNVYLKFCVVFLYCLSFIFFLSFKTNNAVSVESNYYEVENPYRSNLQENYVFDYNDEQQQKLDLARVHRDYKKRRKEILLAEAKSNDEADIKKKEEEQKGDRKKPDENKDIPDITKEKTKLDEREKEEKSWIDDWIIKKDKKPHDVVGMYNSIKLALIIPNDTKFSATEITRLGDNTTTHNLFSGKSQNGFMPALYIAVGNDKWKWFKWEVELGYIPFRASGFNYTKGDNIADNTTFKLSKKHFSAHILSLGLNGFLQLSFLDGKVVSFIGLGVAMGYAWSWHRDLSGDFVLPVVKGALGFTILVRDKGKLNISYNISYMSLRLGSKYQFTRVINGVEQQKQAIYNGELKIKDAILNAIQFEYQFYV